MIKKHTIRIFDVLFDDGSVDAGRFVSPSLPLALYLWLALLATSNARVARALYPGLHYVPGGPLPVRRQAQEAHEVDEAGGEIQLHAVLARGVVVWERVVVVVESLT